jgi:Bacterial Ig-like domain/L,D-transpeptidase catalytic domain
VFGVGRPDEQPAGQEPEGSAEATSSGSTIARSWPGKKVIALGATAAATVVAGGAYALTQQASTASTTSQIAATAHAMAPMRVLSIVPAAGARGVDGAEPITVKFSDPVAANSPSPTLSPALPGTWSSFGNTLTFTPRAPLPPDTRVSVNIPAGTEGVRAATGELLIHPQAAHFTTAAYSERRLAQLLAHLGYLPMSWTPHASGSGSGQLAASSWESVTPASLAYDPPAGTFRLHSGWPAELARIWSPSQPNLMVRGAVMAFQSVHGMSITGDATKSLWHKLFVAAARDERNPNGYTYAIASKSLPETLTIWHNGHRVLRSLANTGIPGSPTVDGTFPVYLRFLHTIMSGTNPDGSHYSDPVSYVSYFNGGDAVHYFVRGSYGSPQSLGCVELPYSAAVRAYPYLTYGSLVTVQG